MQYRTFGSKGWKVSALGFGCMRLPHLEGEGQKLDEPQALEMVRWAIDHGVNFIDTAYVYNDGGCERFLGRALQDGYREKVILSTKLPPWPIQATEDFDVYLDEELDRLQTDHVDVYIMHSLQQSTWHKLRDLNLLDWAEGALQDGRIRGLGFSFHDRYEVFQEIVDAYDRWTVAMFQYNYMRIHDEAGERGLKYAASKGLAPVVLGPVMGGRLVDAPEEVQRVWDSSPRKRTPVDWALQWLWNQPEVSVVLSGMSTMEQVVQNVRSAETAGVNTLTEDDLEIVARVRELYLARRPIPCTMCEKCMPCPEGVNIPLNLQMYNEGLMYSTLRFPMWGYDLLGANQRAAVCNQCGKCEALCPEGIPIGRWMIEIDNVFGKGLPCAGIGD